MCVINLLYEGLFLLDLLNSVNVFMIFYFIEMH